MTSKSTKAPKAKRHPELKRKGAEMITGRIRGTGKRLTDQERSEMRRLRETDPSTYTLRRLAAIFGLDTGSVFYALKGGRSTVEKSRARRKALAKATRRTARKAAAPAEAVA